MSNLTTSNPGPPEIDQSVLEYVRNAISENTRRAYRSDLEHFIAWGGTIPCVPEVLATYLSDQAGAYAVSTIKRRLAALTAAHEAKGCPSPTTSKLIKATLRGIQRIHGTPQSQSKPLLVEDLIKIVSGLGESPKDLRDKALLLVGFAGGFRRSELVAIDCNDIEWVRQGMVITIRRSKTDQTGTGRRIGIPYARGEFCPVRSLDLWILTSGMKSEGPTFRSVSKHGRISNKRLSAEAVAKIVKERVRGIGLNPARYSAHSLRAGLATSAAMKGATTISIRKQTGHRSDAMLARYVREGELFSENAAARLF
ncbi:site-specific integrase [Limibacillus halophilus]|uniref:Integrase n=1 Tax=Limibacillus halophilus TaxID=1579333 RepID=A0A839SYL1_9PROT|nr:integrase [Limibacillus halophilus]